MITYLTLRITPGLWLSEVAAQVHTQMPWIAASDVLAAARSNEVRSQFEPANIHTLEGFLYPDTYRFTKHDTATTVVRTMVKRFDQVATSAGLGTVHVAGLTPYQVLVVASIVQEESGTPHDSPLIASVIDNRLRENMLLQMDATVVYALQTRKASNTAADRANPSPYNTYVHLGLPPTPIGATDQTSLLAALHPPTTTYLYFVVAGRDGHSAFASTLAEHNANVAKRARVGFAAVTVTGQTHLAAIIGDPVRHSLSPVMHNAAFAATGLDWVFVALPVARGEGARALDAIRVLGIEGLNVTMPHKAAAAAACDELRGDAAVLRSVNCVSRGEDGALVGESTDGEGFLRSLRDEGHDPAGVDALVLGAGGASRAVALALAQAGAVVRVAARRREAADECRGARFRDHGRRLGGRGGRGGGAARLPAARERHADRHGRPRRRGRRRARRAAVRGIRPRPRPRRRRPRLPAAADPAARAGREPGRADRRGHRHARPPRSHRLRALDRRRRTRRRHARPRPRRARLISWSHSLRSRAQPLSSSTCGSPRADDGSRRRTGNIACRCRGRSTRCR